LIGGPSVRAVIISILKIAAFFAIWAGGIAAAIFAVVFVAGDQADEHVRWKFAAEVGGLIAVLVALLIMGLIVDRRPFATLGLPARGIFSGLIGGTLIGAIIFCLPIGILMALGYATYEPDFSAFDPTLLALLLAIMFVNVIHQELLVRSYLFQEIWAKYSAGAAVTISTIVFVALHAGAITSGTPGLIAAADIALASLMLGLAYLRTGALWLPIGIHFGWNTLQGPLFGINVTGLDMGERWHAFRIDGPELWTGGDMGIEGGLAGLAGPLLGILIVLLLPQRQTPFGAPRDLAPNSA
jgi:uncharacterized protein